MNLGSKIAFAGIVAALLMTFVPAPSSAGTLPELSEGCVSGVDAAFDVVRAALASPTFASLAPTHAPFLSVLRDACGSEIAGLKEIQAISGDMAAGDACNAMGLCGPALFPADVASAILVIHPEADDTGADDGPRGFPVCQIGLEICESAVLSTIVDCPQPI